MLGSYRNAEFKDSSSPLSHITSRSRVLRSERGFAWREGSMKRSRGTIDCASAGKMGERAGSAVLAVAMASLLAQAPALAASPSSGTLSATNTQVTWTGEFLTPTGEACGGPNNSACDYFDLNIIPPPYNFKVDITLTPMGDWD